MARSQGERRAGPPTPAIGWPVAASTGAKQIVRVQPAKIRDAAAMRRRCLKRGNNWASRGVRVRGHGRALWSAGGIASFMRRILQTQGIPSSPRKTGFRGDLRAAGNNFEDRCQGRLKFHGMANGACWGFEPPNRAILKGFFDAVAARRRTCKGGPNRELLCAVENWLAMPPPLKAAVSAIIDSNEAFKCLLA
jgi:hypothetical protein